MADKTGIEWADMTWNPLAGCTACSPGCDNCYAARLASGRLAALPLYAGLAVGGVFTGIVHTAPERLGDPLRKRRPRRIFPNAMSDLFHPAVTRVFLARMFAVMAMADWHVFPTLTKRAPRMQVLLSSPEFRVLVADAIWSMITGQDPDVTVPGPIARQWRGRLAGLMEHRDISGLPWPLDNVWMGVSVEDQERAAQRVPALLNTPAAVRWVSAEPLLGPVDLTEYLHSTPVAGHCTDIDGDTWHAGCDRCSRLDWVVPGGESGPGARPMHPDWARSLRDQCQAAGVPYLLKQWGEWSPTRTVGQAGDVAFLGPNGERFDERNPPDMDPTWARMYRIGKRAAGRHLDGRLWDEYPQQQVAV